MPTSMLLNLMRKPARGHGSRDYLFARLRCRRSALAGGRPRGWREGDLLWQLWRRDLTWLYDLLPGTLVKDYGVVFVWEELQQLLLGLRFLLAADRVGLERICRESLFNEEFQRLLLGAGDLPDLLDRLEDRGFARGAITSTLRESYRSQGPGGVEQLLCDRTLQQAARGGRTAQIRSYFRALIDLRNLLGYYRHVRWRLTQPPNWIQGGELEPSRLSKAWQRGKDGPLENLVQRATGMTTVAGKDLEWRLWEGLAGRLLKNGRDPLADGQILEYLVRWKVVLREQAAMP